MTRHQNSAGNARPSELEALYRAHAEAEPDSGLDRIIRARAEQALEPAQQRRPGPWIAGLATVGALVLAVGIIVQQTPPPSLPETTPSAPAAREHIAPEPRSAPRAARYDAPTQSSPAPTEQVIAESALASGMADAQIDAASLRLAEIRQLLAAGETAAARERLKALQTDHPEFEIPDQVLKQLEPPE